MIFSIVQSPGFVVAASSDRPASERKASRVCFRELEATSWVEDLPDHNGWLLGILQQSMMASLEPAWYEYM